MSDDELIAMANSHGATWPDASECELTRGELLRLLRSVQAVERERCARIVREAWEVHALCCSDAQALAALIEGLGA